jgi:HEAT repeat protein
MKLSESWTDFSLFNSQTQTKRQDVYAGAQAFGKVAAPVSRLLVLCGFLTFGGLAVPAQAKLEPQPLIEQCSALSPGASDQATLQRQVAQLKSSEAKARQAAVPQLGKTCQSQAVEPLIELLKDPDPLVRCAAIETLGHLGAKDSVEPLVELTADPDWRVRLALVRALSSFKTFGAKNAVLNSIVNANDVVISDEDDLRVRLIGILTLNQLTDVQFSRKAVQFMYSFLRSNNLQFRQLAEQTMFALKDTRNGPVELTGILKQHHMPEMRRWAAQWLGDLHIERGRQALEEAAANDAAPAVKHAATEALAKLNQAAK